MGLFSGLASDLGLTNDNGVGVQSNVYQANSNNYKYNGTDEQQFDQQANAAQGRGAQYGDFGAANQSINTGSALGNADRNMANGAAGAQQNALSLDQQAATGNAPSVAQAQLESGLGQSNNAAASLAAGARGNGAGLAQILASQSQTTNDVNTNQQAAALRAQEMATARSAYNQDAATMRGQDQQQQQTDQGYGLSVGQLGRNQPQFNAQQGQAAQNENDQYALGEQQLGQSASKASQQGGEAYEGQQSANVSGAQQVNAHVGDTNASAGQGLFSGLLNGGGAVAATVSDARLKTGIQPLDVAPQWQPQGLTVQAAGSNALAPNGSGGYYDAAPSTGALAPQSTLAAPDAPPPAPKTAPQGGWQWNNSGGVGAAMGNAAGGIASGLSKLFGGGANPNAPAPMDPAYSSQGVLAGPYKQENADLANVATQGSAQSMNRMQATPSDARIKTGISDLEAQRLSKAADGIAQQQRYQFGGAPRVSDQQAAQLMQQANAMQKQQGYQYGTPVAPAPASDPAPAVGTFLDSLRPYEFKYKDPRIDPTDPGQHYGVMAQDVAKTPMGASLIDHFKGGAMGIDVKRGIGAAMAGEADLNQRVRQLEAELANQRQYALAPTPYKYGGGR